MNFNTILKNQLPKKYLSYKTFIKYLYVWRDSQVFNTYDKRLSSPMDLACPDKFNET